jgi:hypothetical protein
MDIFVFRPQVRITTGITLILFGFTLDYVDKLSGSA